MTLERSYSSCQNLFLNPIDLFLINILGVYMKNLDEQILRATKEIVVKFIEAGRLSPTSFHESFREIYETVNNTAKGIKENSVSSEKTEDHS